MSGSVTVGTLQAVLAVRDEFTASIEKFENRLKAVESSTTHTSRTTKSETDKIRDAYNKVAASLDPVVARTQKYEKSVETLNRALKAGVITQAQYTASLSKAQSQLQASTHWTQRLGASIGSELSGQFTRYFAATAVLSASLGAIISLSHQIVRVNIEKEKSETQLEAAIKRSAAASDIRLSSAIALSDALSELTGVDDEAIQAAIATALQYNRIGSDILPALTQAALDASAATGDNLSSAMEKAAKMVNNPLRALTLLNREGYAVSKSQSDLVKSLLASNDILGAQAEILKILQDRYGGTAAEVRDTMGGAVTALQTTWENFLERVGQDNMGPIREALESIIKLLEFATDHVGDVTIGFHEARVAVNGFVADALRRIADLVDLLSKVGPLFGLVGLAVKGVNNAVDLSARARRGADAADKEALKSANALMKGLLGVSDSHHKGRAAALQQTDAESKLGKATKQLKDDLDALVSTIESNINRQHELLSLWHDLDKPVGQRLADEAQINKWYQDRTKFLELEKKYGTDTAKRISERLESERKITVQVEAQKNRALDYARAVDQINESIRDLFRNAVDMGGLLDRLGDLSQQQARDTLAGRNTDPITQANEEMYDELRRQHEEYWQDYAEEVRRGQASAIDIIEEEMEKIQAAYREGVEGGLTAAEVERELARLRMELLNAEMDHILSVASGWQQLFSQIGSMFGGFASKVASTLQQMISTAQAFQAAGNAIGGQTGSLISSAGPFFAVAGAIIGWQRESVRRSRQRQFTSEAGIGGDTETFGRQGRAIANSLESALQPILEVLGRTLSSLGEITIRAREDGQQFQAIVNNQIIGFFETVEEAIDAAAIAAVQMLDPRGLSETLQRIIEVGAQTSEELLANLNFGEWYDSLGIGDLAGRMNELVDEFHTAIQSAQRLGLETGKITKWFGDQIEDLRNQLLGVDTSTAAILNNIRTFNDSLSAAVDEERRLIEEQIAQAQRDIADLGTGPREFTTEQGRIVRETQEAWERARVVLQAQLDGYIADLERIPRALSDAEINMGVFDALYKYLEGSGKYAAEAHKYALMRVEIEFAAIKAQLIALGKWEEFAGMFDDALAAARQQAGGRVRRGGSGGGDTTRQGVRDFIDDRQFQLAAAGMDNIHRQIAQITRDYDEQLKAAGKDSKLRAELLALRKQETQAAIDANKLDVVKNWQEITGKANPFTELRSRFGEVKKSIEAAGFGAVRASRMIDALTRAELEAAQKLSDQLAAGLLGGLAEIITDETLHADLLRQQEIINFQLRMVELTTEYEMLKAQGLLAQETQEVIERAFGWVRDNAANLPGGSNWSPSGGVGDSAPWGGGEPWPGAWFGAPQPGTGDTTSTSSAIDNARTLLARYHSEGIDEFHRALLQLDEDFNTIRASLGDTPEVAAEYTAALERLREQFLSGLEDFYAELSQGELSGLDIQQQAQAAEAEYERLLSLVRGGDLSQADALESAAQQWTALQRQLLDPTLGGYAEFRSRVLADLGPLLGITAAGSNIADSLLSSGNNTQRGSRTIIGGSEWFTGGATSGNSNISSSAVGATNNVAEVVDIHGRRQERLLQSIIDSIDALSTRVSLAESAIRDLRRTGSQYG